jgi:hypothetical protein
VIGTPINFGGMTIFQNRELTILIDGRVIAAYSRGQIVLPKSNMLDETRRSRGIYVIRLRENYLAKTIGSNYPII